MDTKKRNQEVWLVWLISECRCVSIAILNFSRRMHHGISTQNGCSYPKRHCSSDRLSKNCLSCQQVLCKIILMQLLPVNSQSVSVQATLLMSVLTKCAWDGGGHKPEWQFESKAIYKRENRTLLKAQVLPQ